MTDKTENTHHPATEQTHNDLGREHINETETDADWDADLRPDPTAGFNEGPGGLHPEKADGVKTAYDIKGLHDRLGEFTNDELKGIPIMPEGSRLEQNAVYLDLRHAGHEPIKAWGDMEAGPQNWYVPKSEVDYVTWNRLTGVTNPERLDEEGE